jgi:hypothetical protein
MLGIKIILISLADNANTLRESPLLKGSVARI